MRRLLAVLLLAVALSALAVASTGATIHANTQWDVSIDGTQTLKWSFAAEKPEECVSYYGSASRAANGSGSSKMAFATKKKAPLWAETYMSGNKLTFLSFSTSGWKIPAVFTSRGKFSVTSGMPCGSSPGDPVPLPKITDDSGCGTEKTYMRPSIEWEKGELVLRGSVSAYVRDCPAIFEQETGADPEAPCTPKEWTSGLSEGTLQELHTAVPSMEFLKGKAFTATANHTYICEFPSDWPDKAPLKVELKTRYDIAFTPRKH
jgi:hypothetical protein